jgi:predicted RNase H-like HicB family nuclease
LVERTEHRRAARTLVFKHPDSPNASSCPPPRTEARHSAFHRQGRGLDRAKGETSLAVYVGILEGDGDAWSIRIPDIPGCHGGGTTPEAAIADTMSALRFVATDMAADGQAVPSPRSVKEVTSDPDAEFDPAAGQSLVMIPLALEAASSHHGA